MTREESSLRPAAVNKTTSGQLRDKCFCSFPRGVMHCDFAMRKVNNSWSLSALPLHFRPIEGDERIVVVVVPNINARVAKRAMDVVTNTLGFNPDKIFHYKEGIEKWSAVHGSLEYTKYIRFEALRDSLEKNSVLLVDVRNRTELVNPGQIPGSVCLPLHEIRPAFDELDEAGFLEQYGFERFDEDRKSVVLTCRSGRRVEVADNILERRGYRHLRIYSGSFRDWVRRGGEVITGNFDLDYEVLRG